MKESDVLSGLFPAGVVTVTSAIALPLPQGGDTAAIWVSDSTLKLVATRDPKRTSLAPVKPVPVITTAVSPPAGPCAGLTALTLGTVPALASGARTRNATKVA